MVGHRLLGMVALASLATLPVSGQEVSGDRPGFSNGPLALAAGVTQVEAGVSLSSAGVTDTLTLGEVLLRHGLQDDLEVRIGLPSYQAVDGPGADPSGLSDASLGLKWTAATRAAGSAVDLGLLVFSTVPTGESDLGADGWQPGAAVSVGRELSGRLALGGYAGWTSIDSGESFEQLFVSVALSSSLGERTGVFAELYGLSRESRAGSAALYADAGLTRTLAPRWVVDLSIGAGLDDAATDWFVGAGVVTGW